MPENSPLLPRLNDGRDLLAELHEEQCAHGSTLRKLDEATATLEKIGEPDGGIAMAADLAQIIAKGTLDGLRGNGWAESPYGGVEVGYDAP
jgi:hypothetical protein